MLVDRSLAARHPLFARRPVMDDNANRASVEQPLVDAARRGDRMALGELFERHARFLHGLLLSRVGPGDVDALLQDVFAQAVARVHTLRETAAFGGWLAAITRNRIADFHRSRRGDGELPPDLARCD